MKKKFDEQIEMQIVQDRLSGATIKEIETKYGCNKKYVQRLMKRHSQQGDIQKRDNPQGDIKEGDIRKGDNQGDIHVGDNRTLDIKKLDVVRLEDKKETSNLSDIKGTGTEADARAQDATPDDNKTSDNETEPETKVKSKNPNSAPALVSEFYKKYNLQSANFAADIGRVSNILKLQVEPDCIRMTMDYMYHKGLKNLNYLSSSMVAEAVKFVKYHNETKQLNTLPYFVKKYYEGIGLSLKHSNLIKDVDRLQRLKETLNLSESQLENLISRMTQKKVTVFNFIDNEARQMLADEKIKPSITQDATFALSSEDHYFNNAIKRLCNGHSTFARTVNIYSDPDESPKEKYVAAVETALKEKRYDTKKYTALEWLYEIQYIPLDKTVFNSNTKPIHLDVEEVEDYYNWLKTAKNKPATSERLSKMKI